MAKANWGKQMREGAVRAYSEHLAYLLRQRPLPKPEQVGKPYREVLRAARELVTGAPP
jgi:hypothetical protein